MKTNARNRVKSPDTTDGDTTRMNETRSLLAQALTALDAEEQQRAIASINSATNRLGDRRWPDEHPAGRALELVNCALEYAMVNSATKAGREIREALQFLEAVEQSGEDTEQDDDEEVEKLLTDGGEVSSR